MEYNNQTMNRTILYSHYLFRLMNSSTALLFDLILSKAGWLLVSVILNEL